MNEQRGWYARVEGMDGAGKTTQLALAREFSEANNLDAIFVREPGGTYLGAAIRELLLHNRSVDLSALTELLLFTADRNHLVETVILPGLEQDRPIISDRGVESTKIYQSSGGGIPIEFVEQISSTVLPERYMRPDALALLSIRRATSNLRLNRRFETEAADKMESRKREFYDKVYSGYERLGAEDYVTVVNGERSPEEVFENMKPLLFGKFLPTDKHPVTIL